MNLLVNLGYPSFVGNRDHIIRYFKLDDFNMQQGSMQIELGAPNVWEEH